LKGLTVVSVGAKLPPVAQRRLLEFMLDAMAK